MKKLLIATLAAGAVGGAFGVQVYDYKASIKQVNLTTKNVTYNNVKYSAYVKRTSQAALKGYLILDDDGATSPAIQGLAGSGNSVPATRPADYGRNTAFLVVYNSKAENTVRKPKILPAVLDAKWINDKISDNATSGPAQGYLYVGGDVIAGQVRESLDLYNKVLSVNGRTPAKGFIGDYCWTSIWLFGKYNCPLFDGNGSYDQAEAAIDTAMATAELQQPFTAGTSFFYHDTWMNGAGIGKYSVGKAKKVCCGKRPDSAKTLDTLTGNLKGGIFLCTENGINEIGYSFIAGIPWEDQYFTGRWDDAGANPGAWVGAGDIDQADLWQDGDLELNTRDVISGTWSIKYTSKLKVVPFTKDELVNDLGAAGDTQDAVGLKDLMANIKGAALDLWKKSKKSVVLCRNQEEIWDSAMPEDDGDVPFITPQFCKYYGLFNWK